MKPAEAFREALDRPGLIRLVGAHNAVGAQLVERAGFDGVWASGFELSTSYGVPDAEILTMSEVLHASQCMVDAIGIPVLADCDTGFGNSMNVIHLVHRFEAAGVAGICLEDKAFPKVNSFVPGRQPLAPLGEFVGKILAACNARTSPAFTIVARVEALIAGMGMREAFTRARAYVEAGADAILMHSKLASPQQIAEFMRGWDGGAPVIVVPTTYPGVTGVELEAMGVKVVIYANQGLRAAVRAMQDVLAEIAATDTTAGVEARIAPMSLLFELQGMPQLKQAEEQFLVSGQRTRAIVPAAGDHLADPSMRQVLLDMPITMLDLNGKGLLRRQIDVLNRGNVGDITVVVGYREECVLAADIRRIVNPAWQSTGDVSSIMLGLSGSTDRTLVVYADILFDLPTLRRLLDSDADITLLVDRGLDARKQDPDRTVDLAEVEGSEGNIRRTLSPDSLRRVRRVGQRLPIQEGTCEFAGMALFSPAGVALAQQVHADLLQRAEAPFHEAPSYQKACLTDFLQELLDRGHDIHCVEVQGGWMEIRSFEDYRLAVRTISRPAVPDRVEG